jgi:membrane protease YdiL (CAAX protease family)
VSEVTVTALDRELELARLRVAMGRLLVLVMMLMVAYGFALRVVVDMTRAAADTTMISVPMILGFTVPLWIYMRRSGEPLALYGLTWRGAGPAIRDAILWSLPLLALATLLKLALVRSVPELAAVPVFRMGGWLDASATTADVRLAVVMAIAYLLVVPLQEFVARGALQGALQRFLAGPRTTGTAIVVANFLFVASHLYLSTTFALLAMLPGFLWGALYARHPTLVAPIVSHQLIGWWTLFVLGFDRLLV